MKSPPPYPGQRTEGDRDPHGPLRREISKVQYPS